MQQPTALTPYSDTYDLFLRLTHTSTENFPIMQDILRQCPCYEARTLGNTLVNKIQFVFGLYSYCFWKEKVNSNPPVGVNYQTKKTNIQLYLPFARVLLRPNKCNANAPVVLLILERLYS
jgi:hypothetical protein